jgi:twinkle protein
VANELCALAHSSGAHIHLVAHPRKPMKHDAGPDIADVAGSSDLGRLADNVLFVRRTDQESSTFEQATPMQVVVKKQRHGSGMCGSVDGWFQRGWRQFTREQYPAGPTRYLPDDAYRGQS